MALLLRARFICGRNIALALEHGHLHAARHVVVRDGQHGLVLRLHNILLAGEKQEDHRFLFLS